MSDRDVVRESVTRRWAALQSERASFDAHWREIAEYLLPRQPRFLGQRPNEGGKRNSKIINNVGTIALRTLASGMMSGVTSPARPWFRLTTPDPDLAEFATVKEWLLKVERRLREVFAKSNFYKVMPLAYRELGAFGTAAFALMPSRDDVIRAYSLAPGSFWCAQNDEGRVDVLYRRFYMTPTQMARRWGREALSRTVRTLLDRGQTETWIELLHAIEPNDERVPDVEDAKGMPFRSIYLEPGAGTDEGLMQVGGFREFRALVPRWEAIGDDVYGSSPGMEALGDIKGLQIMERRKGEAIEKQVNPPMVAPVAMRNQRVSILAGDVTYVDTSRTPTGGGFAPAYQPNMRIDELRQDIREQEYRIQQTFFADLFRMISNLDRRQITAREIDERHEEKLLMLGPVLEQLEDDMLDPVIDIAFADLLRRQQLPDPPRELEGTDLRVEYISILAAAQRLVGVGSIERVVGFAANLAAVDPSVMDKIDLDQAVDEYGEMAGVPPRVVRSDDEVSERRRQRQEREQAAQAAAGMQVAADTARSASQADLSGDNALTRALQTVGAT